MSRSNDYPERRDDRFDSRKVGCERGEIPGEASGADRLAREWAEEGGVAVDPYPADWDNIERPGAAVRRNKYGKLYDALAGHVRNEQMLREGRPQFAVACPGGTGTRDMTIRSLEYGLSPACPTSLAA
ncbi:DUF2493 domain-containing protein [Bradyrhizobium hipponense]|uniref:DUF2493 domain-containing protein n=1 Tax=Bradyrhizobium hipponense TaxID=2605638 RepID=A0A5S4YMI0_9BRAD|nr:DUF2493 domain-containing protein [Bradyrhizobium hipponense]